MTPFTNILIHTNGVGITYANGAHWATVLIRLIGKLHLG